ncbi:MAG: nucleotidyltransferase family protein [Pseudomonadota bacterium]
MDLRSPEIAADETDASASAEDEFRLLLCALADPQAPLPPRDVLLAADPDQLFEAIVIQGIEPVSLPKLTRLLPKGPPYFSLLDGVRERQFLANAHCLNLDAVAKRVKMALESARLEAEIVLGSVFAVSLYDKTSDRPYEAIDILVHGNDINPISRLLQDEGFVRRGLQLTGRSGLGRTQVWTGNEDPSLCIRLHTSLIGGAVVRQRVTFGLDEYSIASDEGAHPAVANFMAAMLHATTAGGMRQLQCLVDVLQALRHLNDDDVAHLAVVLPWLQVRPEVLACVELVGALFGDSSSAYVLQRLQPGSQFSMGRRMLSPDSVLGNTAQSGQAVSLRHRMFHVLQAVTPRN